MTIEQIPPEYRDDEMLIDIMNKMNMEAFRLTKLITTDLMNADPTLSKADAIVTAQGIIHDLMIISTGDADAGEIVLGGFIPTEKTL